MSDNDFAFSTVIMQEGSGYTCLCLDLDVASQGETEEQARNAVLEAVTLYLQAAIEHNLPWLRPVPPTEDPRFTDPDRVVAEFPLKVRVAVHAYA